VGLGGLDPSMVGEGTLRVLKAHLGVPASVTAPLTGVDWIIIGFTLLLAVYGYAQGFIVGALSLVGFAAGAVLGTRLGPELLPEGASSPYAPLFGLAGALLAGAILATGLETVAFGLRRRLPGGRGLSAVDGVLGAALTACVALGIAWIAGAVALQTPGARDLRRDIQRSVVLRRLNAVLPPSGPILNALARVDPFPQVDAPSPEVARPRGSILRDRDVVAARRSVVRVLGTACGLGIQGSGWVAAPGVVVTNAHVVAGESDTVVQAGLDGQKYAATPLAFDPRNDIAVLRVEGLGAPALPLAGSATRGRAAAILGYPENGPYDPRAGRVGDTQVVLAQNAYGQGPVRREITSLRGLVRSGNSGGPMVDGRGRVVTTIFAATTGAGEHGGFGVPNDVVSATLQGARGSVDTGPCAAG
jgi:S1-C subfamily serine protease